MSSKDFLSHFLFISKFNLNKFKTLTVVSIIFRSLLSVKLSFLLIVFFLSEYAIQTVPTGFSAPLFRVRNKKKTMYCYDDEERNAAVKELGKNPEITRFKGLGEISPSEFKNFIGDQIRLEPIILNKKSKIQDLLTFYMGKNTPDRQEFIIDKLRVEKDLIESEV